MQALTAGPDRGSEFIIRLPLHHESVEQNKTDVAETKDSKRYRILIIDENTVAARALILFLTGQGHTVEIAHTGPNGVRLAKQFQPDLVLCDIALLGFDGNEVAQQIRKELLHEVLLIAVSGYAEEEVEERASRA